MRSALLALIFVAACGDNNAGKADGGNGHPDSSVHDSHMQDGTIIPVDATIADVRAATDGAVGFTLKNVVVTYLKPQVGDPNSDPAGFTIQKDPTGPAIFVSVDPATLTPAPVQGDVVTLTVTMKATVSAQPRATAITDFMDPNPAQSADLDALTQDVSTAADLVSAVGNYDSELVTVTGTLVGAAGSSGSGFQRFELDTAGITATPALQMRAPISLMNAIDMTTGCTITATKVPFNQFTTSAEITAFHSSEITLSGCAAPAVVSAIATSLTTLKITFSRNVDAGTVLADGSQFTSPTLTGLANPIVSGRSITLTTDLQTAGAAYTVNVDPSVKDLQGSALATTLSANFIGFTQPASLVINEFNANITGSCDMIELRVKTDGSLAGFRLTDRDATTNYMFPSTLQVHKNDFVIVHFNGATAACNGGSTDELTSPIDQPRATHAKNFDTAYDLFTTNTSGLVDTSNVFTLYDPTNTIVDAVFATDLTSTTAAATLTQAGVVFTAGQWTPAGTDDASFKTSAVNDLDQAGNSSAQTGNTLQRINDTDTNSNADWTSGAGAAPTWGTLNAGQTAFP